MNADSDPKNAPEKPFLPYRTWVLMVILTIVVAIVSNTGGFDNLELLFNR